MERIFISSLAITSPAYAGPGPSVEGALVLLSEKDSTESIPVNPMSTASVSKELV